MKERIRIVLNKEKLTGHRELYSKPPTFADEQFCGFGSAALNV